MIIERLTGQNLTDVFAQRLFTPLGMRATVLPPLEDASMPVPFVHGYQYGSFEKASSTDPALPAEQQAQAAAGTLRPDDWSEYNPSWGWAAGSVISTPEDLALWAETLVGGTLLDPATQLMRMASIKGLPAHPAAAGYGYGYGIQKQQSYYGHSGTIAGYNTEVLRNPDTDTTIVVVATPTVAPDGTPVAPALASAVINALP
jgi:D-alanyl-D-alanine carboxypeptidase